MCIVFVLRVTSQQREREGNVVPEVDGLNLVKVDAAISLVAFTLIPGLKGLLQIELSPLDLGGSNTILPT